MQHRTPVIAIDGPAAAGKTTLSTALATRLGLGYVESGRTYRLVAYHALRERIPLDDEQSLCAFCDRLMDTPGVDLYAVDAIVARALRRPDVSRAVSLVAKPKAIRASMTGLIRKLVDQTGPSIVEGRDIGTAVFPDASVKIFLTASAEVRAERRSLDEPERGYADILTEIRRRDEIDATRRHSPMTPATDARVIDTSELTRSQVIETVADECRRADIRWPARTT
jgi:CMP/dCMP kinase